MIEVFLVEVDFLTLLDSFVDGEVTIQQSRAAFLDFLLGIDLLFHELGQIPEFEWMHEKSVFWPDR